jgi:hypothetical protein
MQNSFTKKDAGGFGAVRLLDISSFDHDGGPFQHFIANPCLIDFDVFFL